MSSDYCLHIPNKGDKMFKPKYAIVLLCGLLLTYISLPTNTVTAQIEPPTGLRSLSTNDNSIIVTLTMRENELQIEELSHDGQMYQRLLLPDTVQNSQVGQPQVPVRGGWIGVPTTDGLSVRVIESQFTTLPEKYTLYPAPAVRTVGKTTIERVDETFALDSKTYSANQFYPHHIAKLGETGNMRGQKMVQLQFYPVRYNPVSGDVQLYHTIKVEVSWRGGSTNKLESNSPTFETLLEKTLINYDSLDRPQQSRQNSMGTVDLGKAENGAKALKIKVQADGLYRLNYKEIVAAGFSLDGIDPNKLLMTNQGNDVPIEVKTATTGTFAAQDYILFYATALNNVYTGENVYWLTVAGENGLRMTTRDGTPNGATTPTDYPTTKHFEENTNYWQTMPKGAGQDHWFWKGIISPNTDNVPTSRTYTVTLNNISTTATTATVRVRLKGFTNDKSVSPNHRTKIYVNGTEIDDKKWSGQSIYFHKVAINHGLLKEGDNIIRIETPGGTGASVDQIYVNWIEIDHFATYRAKDNQLKFAAPDSGNYQYAVTGFTADTIHIFDISDSESVIRINNVKATAAGSTFTLEFQDNKPLKGVEYLAVTNPMIVSQDHLELDQPTNWRSANHRADYIIITHPDFYTSALKLAQYRSMSATTKLNVAVAKVDDVYDEFQDGIFNPQAIRSFLTYAYKNWQKPAPSYVLLLGDSNFDYRNYRNSPPINYVPTQIVETDQLGQTPSDNWFVLLTGNDVLPDMFVGRFPAQTAAQADIMVNKTINYEQNPPDNSWNKNVLFIADDGLPGVDGPEAYETVSKNLASRLPYDYTAKNVFVNSYKAPKNPTQDVIDAINGGSLLVNYAGHGAVNFWGGWNASDNQKIFSGSNVNSLTNANRLSIATVANCLSGFFALPASANRNTSMAESLLLSNNGSVAVLAPTGLDYPSGHRVLMNEFYDQIFQDDHYAMGQAVTGAKVATFGQNKFYEELVETFILFGDPAVRLGVSTNFPYVESTLPENGETNVGLASDLGASFNKPMAIDTVSISITTPTGEANSALLPQPQWSSDNKSVVYLIGLYKFGTQYTITLQGKDVLGNELRAGKLGTSWTFSTEGFVAPETVKISGPDDVFVGRKHAFTATVSPATASFPITYTWQATEQSQKQFQTGRFGGVEFNWERPGKKVLSVTVDGLQGTAADTYSLTIAGVEKTIDVANGGKLTYQKDGTTLAEVVVPANSMTETVTLVYGPSNTPVSEVGLPKHVIFAGQSFNLSAFVNNQRQDSFIFKKPVSITLKYQATDKVDEDSLRLYHLDNNKSWQDVADNTVCRAKAGNYAIDTKNNQLTVAICHLSEFALVEFTPLKNYLPVVTK